MTEKPESGNNPILNAMENQFGAGPQGEPGTMRGPVERPVNPGRAGGTDPSATYDSAGNLSMLMGVHLNLTVELGRTNLSVRQVLELQKGTVVELDRTAGEAVDIYVNDRLIAHGDVVVVDDKFGVRITELVSPSEEVNG